MESLHGNLEPEIKGRTFCVKSQMATFDCLYGVTILQLVLRDRENLSKTLQKSCQRKEIADLTLQTINSLRSKQAEVLEVTQPSLPRKRKRPAKLLNENEASLYDEVSDVKTFYRRIYFDAITRFSQPGYRTIRNIEQLILNVINGLEYQNQLEYVLSHYSKEINQYRLSTQLQILKLSLQRVMKNCFCRNKLYEKQHWCTSRFLLRSNCFVKIVSCIASNECCK